MLPDAATLRALALPFLVTLVFTPNRFAICRNRASGPASLGAAVSRVRSGSTLRRGGRAGALGPHLAQATPTARTEFIPTARNGSTERGIRFRNVRLVLGVGTLVDRRRRAVAHARNAEVAFACRNAVRVGLARLIVVRRQDELYIGISAGNSVDGSLAIDASLVDAARHCGPG
jgi:hypothetical protein